MWSKRSSHKTVREERRGGDRDDVNNGGESRITAGLKKWICFLTLDPNTVNTELILSEDNSRVTWVLFQSQSYPYHPDRFDVYRQVLCRESVCGRCYWEIEWSAETGVYISVSYKSISRKGLTKKCVFGSNDQSWSLICSRYRYSFIHNKIQTDLPVKPIISRVGVYDDDYISRIGLYVDVSAGTLSFYSISDTMSLIHTVQTTFTQPLYPGIFLTCIQSFVLSLLLLRIWSVFCGPLTTRCHSHPIITHCDVLHPGLLFPSPITLIASTPFPCVYIPRLAIPSRLVATCPVDYCSFHGFFSLVSPLYGSRSPLFDPLLCA
ncbi:Stonustoxin subunit alpha [Labeo rohita]|uniref:Stonustoxin subunit alpha n=1 Tax=Labeo rohita TaxID=84645 RepID=A0ABQ8L827_LABRO|nr:Stonustoxin subunit alpha [Labeo rohita]